MDGWFGMRISLGFHLLFLALPIAAASQVMTCELALDGPGKQHHGPQAPIFELQKPFDHPSALPSHVLSLLCADKDNAERFEACRSRQNLANIPANWFQATEINLADDELPGLIVNAANACLWDDGQSHKTGGFWIFRQSPTGYQLLFAERTQALQVLKTRTAGYPDLCAIWGSYRNFYNTIYTFEEGKYVPYSEDTVTID